MGISTGRAVENTWDYSVQLSSAVQTSPARITLSWPQDTKSAPSTYTVSRKAHADSAWGPGFTLPGNATSYTDTGVSPGDAYEYRVVKTGGSYTGYGYILTGVNTALVDNRGAVVLVVDATIAGPLVSELARLQQDLVGDGWSVVRHDVARTASVTSVKDLIRSTYNGAPANVKSVFLFGHVPVPYSGLANPDGHPDHKGAWPADVYYGDLDGAWTDSSVNAIQSVNTDAVDAARLSNVPGDGKFDQTVLPSVLELEVGRVDLSNLPGRTTWNGPPTLPDEIELLRNYLNKDHNFRHRISNPSRRAIIGDYIGSRSNDAYVASAFRSFAPLVGAANVRNLNVEYNDQRGVWIPEAATQEYLLAYGSGGGSYSSAGGLGPSNTYNDATTVDLVRANSGGVFNLLYGSWFADWDHADSFLRAPLATNRGLVSVSSGSPHWFIHSMGLGQTIGDSARLTQNNAGLYETTNNASRNRIHIALMGDPTLRLHPVLPISNLNGAASGSSAALTWSASQDSAVVGYHVYRQAAGGGAFIRLTSTPVTATNYFDSGAATGTTYMVRAIKLESTPSGSYFNPAQGISWSVGTVNATSAPAATPSVTTGSSGSTSAPAGLTVWFDDALPAGAGSSANGGDTWDWITNNPSPFSGTKAHRSNPGNGLHEHAFNWAAPMSINPGDTLVTYVYLDPANPPSTIMLSWAAANWEHRAYWGANTIGYGTNDSPSRRPMGSLPAAGQWVRLEIPASAVNLEGASVQGMSFAAYGGRVTWDLTGKASSNGTASPANTPSSQPTNTTSGLTTVSIVATDANAAVGSFSDTATLVFTRSGNPATDLVINYNLGGSAVKWIDYRRTQGDMPVNVTIPAGATSATMTIFSIGNVNNASPATAVFTLSNDGAYVIGAASQATLTFGPSGATTAPQTTPTTTNSTPATGTDSVWFDDSLPGGAVAGSSGGDTWNWVGGAFSGATAHQSSGGGGLHEHYFNWANQTMSVGQGDAVYTYVYLDPANPPATVMLSFGADNWEHRVYWGANNITYGANGSAGRYYAGALPATGQWIRLEVPARVLELEGRTVSGMSFSTFAGRATFDRTGKRSP